ncbi:STAS/SEC14 domain-containing protein [uncultured Pontibacter sp.]|uniref:STAS/SEC14 domain-containing protein n=1 Tax=uncultured Pontibacter sp. TaxID=453356 RepID=UPI002618B8F4|nr:STAS/SEC14 domain-containing protein [uncultured Pontibacter sp.]
MNTKLTNAFGKVYLTIKVDTANSWIHVIWEGYLSENNIKTGGQAILETIEASGFTCVLNDMLLVLGPIRTTDWATDVWAPAVAKAGLKHMALVNAPDAIASTDVSNFHNEQTHFQTDVFGNLMDAGDWLRQQCLKRDVELSLKLT